MSYAQDGWAGVLVQVKPIRRVTVEAEQQFRFQNNFYTLQPFLELGAGYDITSRLNLHAAYRHTNRTIIERVDENRLRISAEASYNIGSDNTAFVLSIASVTWPPRKHPGRRTRIDIFATG